MNRAFALLVVVCLAVPSTKAGPVDDEAKSVAQKLLDKGAELFNTKDAKTMANQYTEEAELVMVIKNKNETKSELKRGRSAIEEFYKDLYKDGGAVQAKNTVEYARFIDRDTLMICGVFEPNGTMKLPFVQIRVKQGDQWLMSHLRFFVTSLN